MNPIEVIKRKTNELMDIKNILGLQHPNVFMLFNDLCNATREVEQALTELEELKATVKELLDIPFTVSTVSGTSLLIKTMNKLEKLVGDKDE